MDGSELTGVPARWGRLLDDGRVRCELCPRECTLREGQRGHCFVRGAAGGKLLLTTYGRSSGFCIDPIEKKPLHHFLPGSSVLSFGTAGCNLACRFCQNHDISKSRQMDTLQDAASPTAIAQAAHAAGAASVAFTYNDPVIFAEYALDTAQACHALGVRTVAVTAGYIQRAPALEFFAAMDAANIDLKSFSDDFYGQQCGVRLQPVLDTLVLVAKETSCWLEVTTLLIPGLNDSDAEVRELSRFCARELGPDVPLHFSAFHPDYKVLDRPTTPLATLTRARAIARDEGVRYVYTGNVRDQEGSATPCVGCGAVLIGRDAYDVTAWGLDAQGACLECGRPLPGRFAGPPGHFGTRRVPVRLAS